MENHNITVENRERITVTEVSDVDSFNEQTVIVALKQGGLLIKGEKLHIQKLDLSEGKVVISGSLQSLTYTEKANKGESGFLKKILK